LLLVFGGLFLMRYLYAAFFRRRDAMPTSPRKYLSDQ